MGHADPRTTRFYDQIGQADKATELVRGAVEQAPENLSLRAQLSTRLRNQGDPDGAEQVLVDAVETFKSAGAWNLLANFYRLGNILLDARCVKVYIGHCGKQRFHNETIDRRVNSAKFASFNSITGYALGCIK